MSMIGFTWLDPPALRCSRELQIGDIVGLGTSYLTNPTIAIGGSAAVWSLTLLAVTMALAGPFATGLSGCCAGLGYLLGVVSAILFFALFGVFSAVAVPAGDVCGGMPRTGDPLQVQSSWLSTFSPNGQLSDLDPRLVSVYMDCLLPAPPTGNLNPMAGFTLQKIKELLWNRTGQGADVGVIDGALNLTAALARLEAAAALISGSDGGVPAGGSAAQNGLAAVNTAQTALQGQVESSQVTLDASAEARAAVVDGGARAVYDVGNCSAMNAYYEGVLEPLCVGAVPRFTSLWALCGLVS